MTAFGAPVEDNFMRGQRSPSFHGKTNRAFNRSKCVEVLGLAAVFLAHMLLYSLRCLRFVTVLQWENMLSISPQSRILSFKWYSGIQYGSSLVLPRKVFFGSRTGPEFCVSNCTAAVERNGSRWCSREKNFKILL